MIRNLSARLKMLFGLISGDWSEAPLEGGLQRFVRPGPVYAETRLGEYVPEANRG